MDTLFLVHIEDSFRCMFPDDLIQNIIDFIESNNIFVVHFTSHILDYEPVEELVPHINRTIEWGWGYEPECHPPEEQEYLICSLGHEWTWIPPFLRSWKNPVMLGGGCEGECLADMESILFHQKILFQRKISFIY